MFTEGKWEVDDILIMSDNTCIARVFKTYYPESQEDNAHRIVQAVNAHDDLVEALRDVIADINKTGYASVSSVTRMQRAVAKAEA